MVDKMVVLWVDVDAGGDDQEQVQTFVHRALELHLEGGQYKTAAWSEVADLYLTQANGGTDLRLAKAGGMREHLGGTELWGGNLDISEEIVRLGPVTFTRKDGKQ